MAENEMIVQYESSFGEVTLTAEDVKKYLVRGSGNLTDQELKLGMELCKYQKLNPFTGEVYFIKFGNDFQLVVGYETYKRRAEENPEYIGRKSGIVVLRGNEVIQKEGTCLYPGERLIGGWCRVYRLKKGKEEETFKEVSLTEYQKMKDGRPSANWASKPCTMIEKVAVSQALRAAFPTDYEGLYVPEEMQNASKEDGRKPDIVIGENGEIIEGDVVDEPITQEDRKRLFGKAQAAFGKNEGNEVVKEIIEAYGFSSTTRMTKSEFNDIMDELQERIDIHNSNSESDAEQETDSDEE